MTDYASEGGHWYKADGSPCYEVEKLKGGGLRPTTLRDAKKLNLFPSVTTIMKEQAAPGLVYWQQKQAALAAKSVRRKKEETDDQYAARVIAKARESVGHQADEGSRIHAAIEQFFLDEPYDPNYGPHVDSVLDQMLDLKLDPHPDAWSAEKSFTHLEYGYAGKVDLSNKEVVVDIKTKDFDENSLPKLYDQHPMQLAAYTEGLGLPLTRGIIIFVSRTVPGLAHSCIVDEDAMIRGFHMFQLLLTFWKVKTGYIPNGEV